MGKAKRRKAAETQTDLISDRLVAAWRNDTDSRPGDWEVFNEVMKKPDPARIILRAAMSLPEEDRHDFSVDMYEIAGNDYRTFLVGSNKRPIEAELTLFTVIVRGPEHEINEFTKSDTFTKVAKLFRACGFAHDQSNVVLCPLPIDACAAGDADPSDVRRVLEALWAGATGGKGDLSKQVANCLNVSDSIDVGNVPGSIRVVTRLFVGARLLPYKSSDTKDLFDAPNYDIINADSEANDDAFVNHEVDKAEASIRFKESAMTLFEEDKLLLNIDGPFNWAKGIGMVALNHLMGSLFLEAAMNRQDSSVKADEVHVAYTSDELFVALKYGPAFIGPVSAPMHMAQYGMDEITDWLVESAGTVLTYEDLPTFQRAIHPHYQH